MASLRAVGYMILRGSTFAERPGRIHMKSSCLHAVGIAMASLGLIAAAAPGVCAQAPTDSAPPVVRHELSGDTFTYQVGAKDSSDSIAAKFGEPQLTMLPDGSEPQAGSMLAIDNRHIAPADVDQGVVVNIPQRMLFLFRDGHLAAAWPVTVGRPDWPTPQGAYKVASLTQNPTWHVPPAIRAEMEDDGIPTSKEVAPGPHNPLGKNWIGLDHGGIGIHGTNHPDAIYLFGSHGCIRLTPDAVGKLFHMVGHHEPVDIVYEPVALAVLPDGRIFVESDPDPYEEGHANIESLHAAARAAGVENQIDWQRASRALVMVEGIARRVDRGQDTESASAAPAAQSQ